MSVRMSGMDCRGVLDTVWTVTVVTCQDVEGINSIQDKDHLLDSSSLLSFTNTQLQRSPHDHPFLLVMDDHGDSAQN